MSVQLDANGKFPIDAALVQRLVAAQFPQWANLPIRRVETEGWDNRTFHLGDDMKVHSTSARGETEPLIRPTGTPSGEKGGWIRA